MNLTPELLRVVSFTRARKRLSVVMLEGILNRIPTDQAFTPEEVKDELAKVGHYISLGSIVTILQELVTDELLERTGSRPVAFRFPSLKPLPPPPEEEHRPGGVFTRLTRIEKMLELLLTNLGVELP